MKRKIAIQGIRGSFPDIAAHRFFEGDELDIIACDTFGEVVEAVKTDPNEVLGLMAIENTIAGSLLQNHELIRQSDLRIIGEYKLRIAHALMALPGQKLEDIMEVNSHPIALMQCTEFLSKMPWAKMVEKEDTAGSAEWISRNKLMGHAAICGRWAAETYGMEILADGIETNKRNFTRFLAVADRWVADGLVGQTEKNKASVVFMASHTVGSLSKVLTVLSFYDVNISKIQSMPIIGREWEYQFYVNLNFTDYHRYCQALDAIRPLTNELKILGEYAEGKQSV